MAAAAAKRGRVLLAATVTEVAHNSLVYAACRECYCKLIEPGSHESGKFKCPKCSRSYHEEKVYYRYRMCATITDFVSSANITAFGAMMDMFFGASASEFHRTMSSLKEKYDDSWEDMMQVAVEQVFLGSSFLFGFKVNSAVLKASQSQRPARQVLLSDIVASPTSSQISGTKTDLIAVQIVHQDQASPQARTVVDILHNISVVLDARYSSQRDSGAMHRRNMSQAVRRLYTPDVTEGCLRSFQFFPEMLNLTRRSRDDNESELSSAFDVSSIRLSCDGSAHRIKNEDLQKVSVTNNTNSGRELSQLADVSNICRLGASKDSPSSFERSSTVRTSRIGRINLRRSKRILDKKKTIAVGHDSENRSVYREKCMQSDTLKMERGSVQKMQNVSWCVCRKNILDTKKTHHSGQDDSKYSTPMRSDVTDNSDDIVGRPASFNTCTQPKKIENKAFHTKRQSFEIARSTTDSLSQSTLPRSFSRCEDELGSETGSDSILVDSSNPYVLDMEITDNVVDLPGSLLPDVTCSWSKKSQRPNTTSASGLSLADREGKVNLMSGKDSSTKDLSPAVKELPESENLSTFLSEGQFVCAAEESSLHQIQTLNCDSIESTAKVDMESLNKRVSPMNRKMDVKGPFFGNNYQAGSSQEHVSLSVFDIEKFAHVTHRRKRKQSLCETESVCHNGLNSHVFDDKTPKLEVEEMVRLADRSHTDADLMHAPESEDIHAFLENVANDDELLPSCGAGYSGSERARAQPTVERDKLYFLSANSSKATQRVFVPGSGDMRATSVGENACSNVGGKLQLEKTYTSSTSCFSRDHVPADLSKHLVDKQQLTNSLRKCASPADRHVTSELYTTNRNQLYGLTCSQSDTSYSENILPTSKPSSNLQRVVDQEAELSGNESTRVLEQSSEPMYQYPPSLDVSSDLFDDSCVIPSEEERCSPIPALGQNYIVSPADPYSSNIDCNFVKACCSKDVYNNSYTPVVARKKVRFSKRRKEILFYSFEIISHLPVISPLGKGLTSCLKRMSSEQEVNRLDTCSQDLFESPAQPPGSSHPYPASQCNSSRIVNLTMGRGKEFSNKLEVKPNLIRTKPSQDCLPGSESDSGVKYNADMSPYNSIFTSSQELFSSGEVEALPTSSEKSTHCKNLDGSGLVKTSRGPLHKYVNHGKPVASIDIQRTTAQKYDEQLLNTSSSLPDNNANISLDLFFSQSSQSSNDRFFCSGNRPHHASPALVNLECADTPDLFDTDSE